MKDHGYMARVLLQVFPAVVSTNLGTTVAPIQKIQGMVAPNKA